MTNAWWDGPYFHPRTWQAQDISATLIDQLRNSNHGFEATEGVTCNSKSALESLSSIFPAEVGAQARNSRSLQQVSKPFFTLDMVQVPL